MKTRKGFVSNSSSSSFLLIFNKKPETEQELKNILFPGKSELDIIPYYEQDVGIFAIVDCIFRELNDKGVVCHRDLIEFFNDSDTSSEFMCENDKERLNALNKENETYTSNYYKEYHSLRQQLNCPPKSDPVRTEENKKIYDKYTKLHDDLMNFNRKIWDEKEQIIYNNAKTIAANFIKNNKDKYMTVLTFSDNNNDVEAAVEHGEIFNNIPHIKNSQH